MFSSKKLVHDDTLHPLLRQATLPSFGFPFFPCTWSPAHLHSFGCRSGPYTKDWNPHGVGAGVSAVRKWELSIVQIRVLLFTAVRQTEHFTLGDPCCWGSALPLASLFTISHHANKLPSTAQADGTNGGRKEGNYEIQTHLARQKVAGSGTVESVAYSALNF